MMVPMNDASESDIIEMKYEQEQNTGDRNKNAFS